MFHLLLKSHLIIAKKKIHFLSWRQQYSKNIYWKEFQSIFHPFTILSTSFFQNGETNEKKRISGFIFSRFAHPSNSVRRQTCHPTKYIPIRGEFYVVMCQKSKILYAPPLILWFGSQGFQNDQKIENQCMFRVRPSDICVIY